MKPPSTAALMLAAQAWCQDEARNREMDPQMALAVARIIDPMLKSLEEAWAIIANSGRGDWSKESLGWVKAATHWRDTRWHRLLRGSLPIED